MRKGLGLKRIAIYEHERKRSSLFSSWLTRSLWQRFWRVKILLFWTRGSPNDKLAKKRASDKPLFTGGKLQCQKNKVFENCHSRTFTCTQRVSKKYWTHFVFLILIGSHGLCFCRRQRCKVYNALLHTFNRGQVVTEKKFTHFEKLTVTVTVLRVKKLYTCTSVLEVFGIA